MNASFWINNLFVANNYGILRFNFVDENKCYVLIGDALLNAILIAQKCNQYVILHPYYKYPKDTKQSYDLYSPIKNDWIELDRNEIAIEYIK